MKQKLMIRGLFAQTSLWILDEPMVDFTQGRDAA
jgi:ABC-type transport system involved in cytochrome c biogenesis ATPase subunit